ncbi:hypothetical protein FEZ48_06175 [Marinilactibacillus psychrotolerans]|uniref:Head-tail adaptor protein n=1 Tax=Marinilactibacillus psychrotolerans TaxID=191770 RepID=A0A5R9C3Y5_9LACT|nr:hypothetical protein [Marinilactibacillus psychrotolerans]TLQ07565.1 hypothetical protein FEZ48_06175 [Marinilactibacillus psychrotolerans]
MRLFPLFLYANSQTGEDALDNPITELVVVGESEGIFSTWTDKEVALDKRNVTVNNRKILTRAKKLDIAQSSKVLFEGLYHTITEVKGNDYDRWRLIIVNRYGSETL